MPLINVPVDLAITVATTAKVDLLANGSSSVVVANAGGNGALKTLTDAGYTLAGLGIALPATDELCWLAGYNIEVDTACVVQFGYLKADGTFTAFDTHVCTTVAAGGIVKNQFPNAGFTIPLGADLRLGLQVSGVDGATVRVSGNIDILRNP